jgi:DNA-binding HxlR family transcriptional regulator
LILSHLSWLLLSCLVRPAPPRRRLSPLAAQILDSCRIARRMGRWRLDVLSRGAERHGADRELHPRPLMTRGAVARQEGGRHQVAFELPEHLARELEVLAKRWTPPASVSPAAAASSLQRTGRAVPGLTNRVLADRLRELHDAGLVDRQVDPGPPITSMHALKADGEALRPILTPLRPWADRRARTRPG